MIDVLIPSALLIAVLGFSFKNTADINKIKGKLEHLG